MSAKSIAAVPESGTELFIPLKKLKKSPNRIVIAPSVNGQWPP
jgi:hypothetical protein